MNTHNIRIQEFNMRKRITPGSKIVVMGHPKSGKSWVVRHLFHTFQDTYPVARIWSGSESTQPFYTLFNPKIFVEHGYNEQSFKKAIARQVRVKRNGGDPRTIFCFDDVGEDSQIYNKRGSPFRLAFKNARNWGGVLIVVVVHSPTELTRLLRSTADFVFLFKSSSPQDSEDLYKFFGGSFESKQQFLQVYKATTGNHSCMVLDNSEQSRDISNRVFHFKARDLSRWRGFGALEARAWSKARYDHKWHKREMAALDAEFEEDQ